MTEELDRNLLKEHDPFSVISGFHYTLVELSNNTRLIELYKILSVSLRRYWLIYHSKKGQKDVSLEHHQEGLWARGLRNLISNKLRNTNNNIKLFLERIPTF